METRSGCSRDRLAAAIPGLGARTPAQAVRLIGVKHLPTGSVMRTIIHLVDADLARGAQRSAQMLVDALDGTDAHLLATIFDSPTAALRPDIELGVGDGRLRAVGWAPRAVQAIRSAPTIADADLVVAHGGEALKYAAAASPAGRLVYHKIGLVGRGFERRSSARLHRWSVARADAVVAISEEARRESIDLLSVDPERVVVIPNARNPEWFRPLPRDAAALPQLAWVGHMSRTKRPHLFVDLVEELRWRGHLFDAVMAGAGPLLGEVQRRASSLDIDVRGSIDDVASLLGRSDLLVFTSIREGEGMPGVLLEAAMCGAVPVTTDVPGARDVVLDGRTGSVVDPDDVDRLVESVERYLVDPLKRAESSADARRHASSAFSVESVARTWSMFCTRTIEESLCASSI